MTEGTKTGTMWIEGGPNHLAPYNAGDTRPAQGQGNVVGLTQGYVYPNVAPRPAVKVQAAVSLRPHSRSLRYGTEQSSAALFFFSARPI
jgi:hypothetical protein